MPEISAPRPSEAVLKTSNTDLKEIPPTVHAGVLINQSAGSPSEFGVQPMDSHKKPDLLVEIYREPGSQNRQVISPGETTPPQITNAEKSNEDIGALLPINERLDSLSADLFGKVAQEVTRRGEAGLPNSEQITNSIIDNVTASNPEEAGTSSKKGISELKPGSFGRNGTRAETPYLKGEMPKYSSLPFGDKPDASSSELGDLPPGPSTGEYNGPVPFTDNINNSNSVPLSPEFSKKYSEIVNKAGFGMPPSEAEEGDVVETPEAKATIDRAGRLAGFSFVKNWMNRVRNHIQKQPEVIGLANRPTLEQSKSAGMKLDKRLGVALVGLAGIAMVLLSGRDGKVSSPNGPAAMPGNQYGPTEYTYDRPGLDEIPAYRPLETSPPPVNETIAVEEPLPSLPNSEKIQFPDNVKDRSLDGLVRKKIVEQDPEFQRWLQETGTNSADVATGDPQFQAALYRTTQKMGGANLEKVVKELVKKQKEEIKARNRGVILDPVDNNKIARSEFEMRAIDDNLIQEAQDKVKTDQLVKAKDASEYIKGLVNLSSDPAVEKLLEDLDKNPEKFELTQTMGKDGDPYFVDIYDIKGQNGEPIMTYQIESMSDGRISKAMTYRKDRNGKFITVKMGDEPGILESDQSRLFTEAFPGVDVSNFKSSMGMYENGGFGRSFYGDWEIDGKRYSGGIDPVGRISVRQNP